jgi:hypothetical protein
MSCHRLEAIPPSQTVGVQRSIVARPVGIGRDEISGHGVLCDAPRRWHAERSQVFKCTVAADPQRDVIAARAEAVFSRHRSPALDDEMDLLLADAKPRPSKSKSGRGNSSRHSTVV